MSRARLEMLGLCLLAITLSFVLANGGDGKVHLPPALQSLWSGGLPPACPSEAIFGLKCPGCGMIRSFVAMAHFDLAGAFAWNWGGPLLFLLALVQIPYRIYLLRTDEPAAWTVSPRLAIFGYVTIALMFGGWIFDILRSTGVCG